MGLFICISRTLFTGTENKSQTSLNSKGIYYLTEEGVPL